MNPRDPDVLERQEVIRKMLMEGTSAATVSKAVGISLTRVYDYARRHRLPTNPFIRPDSPKEKRIIRALMENCYTVNEVGDIFGQAPSNIMKIIERVQVCAEKLDHCRRQ